MASESDLVKVDQRLTISSLETLALPALHPAFGKLNPDPQLSNPHPSLFRGPSFEFALFHAEKPKKLTRLIAIPTTPNGGNHTPAFADAANSEEAHAAAMCVSKGLALTGYRVLSDAQFCQRVRPVFFTHPTALYPSHFRFF